MVVEVARGQGEGEELKETMSSSSRAHVAGGAAAAAELNEPREEGNRDAVLQAQDCRA